MTSDQITSQQSVDGTAGPTSAAEAVTRALVGRELLTHPFYLRWEAGTLERGELAEYAVHYRAFEAALPAVLTAVAVQLRADGNEAAAESVARNLADELGRPEPHLALFDRFADALADDGPAPAAGSGAAAEALVRTYFELTADGPVAALAGLAAYETQASAIAASKSGGLRRWYGLNAEGTAFWDVHARMDAEHGQWATEALELLDADPAEANAAARRGADAWWALLDEREAEAPGSAELRSHH